MLNEALALVLVAALGAAKADPNEAAARAAATEAKTAFDAGDFARAAEKYGDAYQLKQAPRLLFNLGQCHRQLKQHDKAITFFQRYLDTSPPADQAGATSELIADEKKLQAADQEAQAQQQQLELEKARAQTAQAEASAQHERNEEARRSLESIIKDAPAPPPPPEPRFYEKWWFWTGVGVVVAGGAAAAIAVSAQPHKAATSFPDINAR